MRLYDNAYASSYEELKTYYPVWYRDVVEMDVLWQVFGTHLDEIRRGIIQAVENSFVAQADLETIIKLEKFLYITYDGVRTLEERRRLVKSFLVGFGKMSASVIRELIFSFTNASADIKLEPFDEAGNNCLFITAERGDTDTLFLADLDSVLRKKLPAHIVFKLFIRFALRPVVVETPRVVKAILDYPFCGTRPEPALLGSARSAGTAIYAQFSKALIDFDPASEDTQSGSKPEETLLAAAYATALETFAELESLIIEPCAASADNPTGRMPEAALLGKASAPRAGVAVDVQSGVVDYIPCGTKFAE